MATRKVPVGANNSRVFGSMLAIRLPPYNSVSAEHPTEFLDLAGRQHPTRKCPQGDQ
jgi:hypothetical protein